MSIKCLCIIVTKFCSTSWTSHLQMEYLIAYPWIPFNTSFIWDIKCTWFDVPLFPLAFVNGSLEAHFEVNLRLISTIFVACETNSKINERSQLQLQFNLLWWYIKHQGALNVRWCVIIDVGLASFYSIFVTPLTYTIFEGFHYFFSFWILVEYGYLRILLFVSYQSSLYVIKWPPCLC